VILSPPACQPADAELEPVSEAIPTDARVRRNSVRAYSLAELIADGIVHGVGLLLAVVAGSALLIMAAVETAPEHVGPLVLYVGTMVMVLSASLAFNLWPMSPFRGWLARLDQAAIFLFIAGTYTPFLAVVGETAVASLMMTLVWGAALVGVALKLIVPERFGRLAILLYLAIGWSGVFVFQTLATVLPPTTLWLLLAGGIAYSAGIVFHVWDRLKFQNVLWHVFVVTGASLHLWATLDCMVFSRL
jgi:hemolysin III